jgi:hypothetical protein
MGSVPPLLTVLLLVVSGWVHRHQLVDAQSAALLIRRSAAIEPLA